jgi:hypothetical protein
MLLARSVYLLFYLSSDFGRLAEEGGGVVVNPAIVGYLAHLGGGGRSSPARPKRGLHARAWTS